MASYSNKNCSDAMDCPAGRNGALAPPPLGLQGLPASRESAPVETQLHETPKVGGVFRSSDKEGDGDVFGPPSRTTSGSTCSTALTLDSFLSSAPSTPRTTATSTTFDEPHSYDGADAGPTRTTSFPVKGAHSPGSASRMSSIDLDISAAPGFPSEPQLTGRTFWKVKHSTFPIRTTHRYSSPSHSFPRSGLRKEAYPPAPEANAEPVIEKDSGLGDETDTMDETSDTCESIPNMPEIPPEWRSRENR